MDLVFLADTATLPAIELDEKSVALNYDFEMDVESIFSSGWNSKSGQDFKLLNVIDSNSPSGYQHLQVRIIYCIKNEHLRKNMLTLRGPFYNLLHIATLNQYLK